jgi:hypothetical protein
VRSNRRDRRNVKARLANQDTLDDYLIDSRILNDRAKRMGINTPRLEFQQFYSGTLAHLA